MSLINKTNIIKLLIIWFPISFLTIKHGVHISLYALFLLFIYESLKGSNIFNPSKQSILIAASLGSIFFATVIQQVITSNINFSAWDGPSRLLIAGIVFLYLQQRNINYAKVLGIAIPLSLITLCIYLGFNQKYYWGQRWANIFVDPNSLGSQCTILSMICLLSLDAKLYSYPNVIKVLGAIGGFYISIKSESRGGWSAMPMMTLCWLLIQIKQLNFQADNKTQLFKILGVFLLLIAGIASLVIAIDTVQNRLSHTIYEIATWFKNPLIYTSAGSRMSMWMATFQLISDNLMGYGEITIKEILANHPLHESIYLNGVKDMIVAGPHADLLSKGLSLGILGIIAYLLTILTPAVLFVSRIKSQDIAAKTAAQMGLIYVTGVFVVGLFNETLSLKYLCTFYGLMIACLAGQILYSKTNPTKTSKAI